MEIPTLIKYNILFKAIALKNLLYVYFIKPITLIFDRILSTVADIVLRHRFIQYIDYSILSTLIKILLQHRFIQYPVH